MAFYKVNGKLAFLEDGKTPPAGWEPAADPNLPGVTDAYLNSQAYQNQKQGIQGGGVNLPKMKLTPQQQRYLQQKYRQMVQSGMNPQMAKTYLQQKVYSGYQQYQKKQPQSESLANAYNQGNRYPGDRNHNTSGIPGINPATGERDWTKMQNNDAQMGFGPKGQAYKAWQSGMDPGADMLYGRHPYDPANYWYKPGDLGYATRDDMYAGRAPWLYAYNQAKMLQETGYNAANPYKTVENDPGRAWDSGSSNPNGNPAAPNWADPFNQKPKT